MISPQRRKERKERKEDNWCLPVRGRQTLSFATLRVIIRPKARVGLLKPSFQGIEQKGFSLRPLRLVNKNSFSTT
jgi:hypothetical protein